MSYRDERYYRQQPPRNNIAGMIGWGFVGIVSVVVLSAIGWLALGDIRAQYATGNAVATQAPAVPTSFVAQPRQTVQEPQRVIVQLVPAGEAPQELKVSDPPAAPTNTDSGNDGNENNNQPQVPAPIIIVHQVSADGTHQSVTGSGACRVARVAARCSK